MWPQGEANRISQYTKITKATKTENGSRRRGAAFHVAAYPHVGADNRCRHGAQRDAAPLGRYPVPFSVFVALVIFVYCSTPAPSQGRRRVAMVTP